MSTLQIFTLVVLLNGVCGEFIGLHILGGADLAEGEYPYMAILNVQNHHTCGCSILNSNWVLTAGHCVYEKENVHITVEYGSRKINEMKWLSVSAIVMHPEYASENLVNDIALLKIFPSITINPEEGVLPLAERNNAILEGETATILGWGKKTADSPISNILQKLDLIVLSAEMCKEELGDRFSESLICAGTGGFTGKNVCSEDAGGPLIVDGLQVGVGSWSVEPCTGAPHPIVFTNVAVYYEWIKNTMAAG